jgi:hypothetical protein
VTQNREETRRLAGEIRTLSRQLVGVFGKRDFGAEDMRALLAGIAASGNGGDFFDYAVAEQATMAIGSILSAMRAGGHVPEDGFKRMNDALQRMFAAVAKDEAFRPGTYRAALRDFEQTIPR